MSINLKFKIIFSAFILLITQVPASDVDMGLLSDEDEGYTDSAIDRTHASRQEIQKNDPTLMQKIIKEALGFVETTIEEPFKSSASKDLKVVERHMREQERTVWSIICETDITKAYCQVAEMFFQGSFLPQNRELALKFYEEALACDAQCFRALSQVGKYYEFGLGGIAYNLDEAIQCYRESIAYAIKNNYEFPPVFLLLNALRKKVEPGPDPDHKKKYDSEAYHFQAEAYDLLKNTDVSPTISYYIECAQVSIGYSGGDEDLEMACEDYMKAWGIFKNKINNFPQTLKYINAKQRLELYVQNTLKKLEVSAECFHNNCPSPRGILGRSSSEVLWHENRIAASVRSFEAAPNIILTFLKEGKGGEFIESLGRFHQLSHELEWQIDQVFMQKHPEGIKTIDISNFHELYLLVEAVKNNAPGSEMIKSHYTKMLWFLADLGHLEAKKDRQKFICAQKSSQNGLGIGSIFNK